MEVSGHHGSRREDLATAANLVHGDSLSFGRAVSHIVSLSALPESMLALARDRKIQGVPAQRVVVDMEACHKVVERAEELPLRHLGEAAKRPRSAIGSGNLFRDIGFEGPTSLLSWAHPPSWQEIQLALVGALDKCDLSLKQHIIWVGTGGWIFLVDALEEMMPASRGGIAFHTCQRLDPKALADLLLLIDDLSTAACVGIRARL